VSAAVRRNGRLS